MDEILRKLAAKLWAFIREQIREEFAEQKSEIATVVIAAVAESAAQLVIDTTDQVTKAIPGKADDWVVDQIKNQARDRLAQLGIHI